jgi:hypothetical protein
VRRHLVVNLLLLVAGILWVPAIGASAQVTIPTLPTTTTTTEPEETTTTTEATTTTTEAEETTTTTEPEETTTTTEETTTTTASTTTTTIAPAPGVLSISAPTATQLSPGTPTNAGVLTALLGTVVVTDDRGVVGSAWTASVTTSHFVTGDGSAAETIDRANVAYWSGPATDGAGVGVFTPGQLTEMDAETLEVPRTAFSMASGVGDNAVSWTPTIVVTIPPSAIVGEYMGTITHSVA